MLLEKSAEGSARKPTQPVRRERQIERQRDGDEDKIVEYGGISERGDERYLSTPAFGDVNPGANIGVLSSHSEIGRNPD